MHSTRRLGTDRNSPLVLCPGIRDSHLSAFQNRCRSSHRVAINHLFDACINQLLIHALHIMGRGIRTESHRSRAELIFHG